jgi:microfibrillar-associated protein 1
LEEENEGELPAATTENLNDDIETKEVEEDEEEEEEEDEESEEESEEETYFRPTIAPVFKSKKERDTLQEPKKLVDDMESLEKEKLKRTEERKLETKEILEQEKKRNIEEQALANQKIDKDDDINVEEEDENINQAEEYEAWKLRELARIKREQVESEKAENEAREVSRRRKLTDTEIMQEDKDILAPKEKKKMKYLQKYYHAGAFYRSFDEGDIASKYDFTAPTLEDKVDKSILPSVMQVKNFGRSGRTKYTHLVDQDTTQRDSPWFQKDSIRDKYNNKLGGMGAIVDPNKKRKS